jgi:hypothetical protein
MPYRGPDHSGVWVGPDGCCALSHRRLSIIDTPSAGHLQTLFVGVPSLATRQKADFPSQLFTRLLMRRNFVQSINIVHKQSSPVCRHDSDFRDNSKIRRVPPSKSDQVRSHCPGEYRLIVLKIARNFLRILPRESTPIKVGEEYLPLPAYSICVPST